MAKEPKKDPVDPPDPVAGPVRDTGPPPHGNGLYPPLPLEERMQEGGAASAGPGHTPGTQRTRSEGHHPLHPQHEETQGAQTPGVKSRSVSVSIPINVNTGMADTGDKDDMDTCMEEVM